MSDGRFGYVPNLHVILDGEDRARAGMYLPFGVELVRKLIRQGRYVNSKTVAVDDGTRIHAKVVGEQRYLRIESPSPCELYMESGFTDWGAFGRHDPARFEPARVFYGDMDPTGRLYGKVKNGAGSEPPASGQYSPRAFFYKDRKESEPYFPESESLWKKKIAAREIPASLYSGKMRLFVQAKYGGALFRSSGGDALFDWEPLCRIKEHLWAQQPYFVTSKGVPLKNDSSLTTGLYTDENDGSYWLLQAADILTVHRVDLTECGQAMYRFMKADEKKHAERGQPFTREKRAEYEAYMLADAKISSEFKFTLQNLPAIAPVAYGWKFNWNGSKATCISLNQHGSGNNTYWRASRQDFTVTRDTYKNVSGIEDPIARERARWSMTSANQDNAGEFTFTFARSSLWAPRWFDMMQELVSGTNVHEVLLAGGGPLYCWYDDKDELVLCNYSISASPDEETEFESPPYPVCSGIVHRQGGLRGATSKHTLTGRTTHSIEVGANGFTLKSGSGTKVLYEVDIPETGEIYAVEPYKTRFMTAATRPEIPESCGVVEQICIPRRDTVKAAWDAYQEWYANMEAISEGYVAYHFPQERLKKAPVSESVTTHGGYSVGGHVALVIPFFDCEAAYAFWRTFEISTEASKAELVGSLTGGDGLVAVEFFANFNWWNVDHWEYATWGPFEFVLHLDTVGAGTVAGDVLNNHTGPNGIAVGKHGSFVPTMTNLGSILSPSVSSPESSKVCITYMAAMGNRYGGSDLTPSHADYDYTKGSFLGWI